MKMARMYYTKYSIKNTEHITVSCVAEFLHFNFHRIIQSLEWFVLEGTSEIILFQLPAMGTDTFLWTRFPKSPLNQALNFKKLLSLTYLLLPVHFYSSYYYFQHDLQLPGAELGIAREAVFCSKTNCTKISTVLSQQPCTLPHSFCSSQSNGCQGI